MLCSSLVLRALCVAGCRLVTEITIQSTLDTLPFDGGKHLAARACMAWLAWLSQIYMLVPRTQKFTSGPLTHVACGLFELAVTNTLFGYTNLVLLFY